ncbi:MAG: hypothetical protein JWM34_2943 [Ilumatobacteraceae bacterium]|nr:hypothetical protein [Ilumatobacteraceae bacterium]
MTLASDRQVGVAADSVSKQEPATASVRISLLVMVLFFGGSLPAYKLASASFGPATTNLGRFVIAAAVLVFVARKRLHTARGSIKRLLMIGAFGIGVMAVFMAIGVDQGSATIGSIVVGLEPIGVALAGIALVGDKPSRHSVMALIVGFGGAFVASGILTEKTGDKPIVPMLLLLGTVVAFSVYTAFVRRASKGVDPLAVAAVTQVGALFLVIPACLFDVFDKGMVRTGGIHPKAFTAVLFLGFGSALGYFLLCKVIAHQPPSRVAVSMFLTPLLGVIFSWWIVGEALHVRDAVGGVLVLTALWISERAPKPGPNPVPEPLAAEIL